MSIQGTASLIIDFGNSQTRATVVLGRRPNGKLRQETTSFSNRFYEIPEGYTIPEQYLTDPDTIIFKHSDMVWATGSIVDREFTTQAIRPTGANLKANALTTLLSFQKALFMGYNMLSDMGNADYNDINVEWDIHVLVPPVEMAEGKKELQESLPSIKEIDFLQPELKKKINIKSVSVYPEGFSAYIGAIFDPNGPTIRKGQDPYTVGSTLIIDVGAGTTDFAIVKDQSLVEEAKATAVVGGNNVEQRVRRKLLETNIRPAKEDLTKAVETGYLKQGISEQDISEEVNFARSEVANLLREEAISFIESSSFPIQSLDYVLICGGGAESIADNPGLVPLGDYLSKEFQNYAKYTERIPVAPELGLRKLNLIGASVLSVI